MIDDDARARFHRDGYLVLRKLVPDARVRAARTAIADALERDESVGEMPRFLAGTFLPSITAHPDIVGLYDPARPHIASLFGVPEAPRPATGQIALRFPERARVDAHHGYHLDGFPTALNGVARGTIHRHTLLVGVYLTPLRGPDRGNFVLWPGSHRRAAALFRELGAPAFLREHGAEALLDRVREDRSGDPLQLEVEPGDVVLAHHLLAHGASDNLSLRVRETIYFRVLHPSDDAHDPEPLMDAARFFPSTPRT